MQAPIDAADATPAAALGVDYLAHFKAMSTRAMAAFKRQPPAGSVLIFAPELLCPETYYARVFPGPDGALREETDRYAQARLCRKIALECFAEA